MVDYADLMMIGAGALIKRSVVVWLVHNRIKAQVKVWAEHVGEGAMRLLWRLR